MPAPLLCCIFFLLPSRFVSASRCRGDAVKPSSRSQCRGWVRVMSPATSYDARGVHRGLKPCGNQFLVRKGTLRRMLWCSTLI